MTRTALRSFGLAVLLVATLTGCPEDLPEPQDGGTSDAGEHDAGEHDAGAIDAGEHDAGAIDAGSADAGANDAGSSDAGTSDGGIPASVNGVLLSYHWGNQITGSGLEVVATAGVLALKREERTCCPPAVSRDAGVPSLSTNQSAQLYGWIRDCEGKAVLEGPGDGGSLGSSSGSLVLHPDGGTLRTVVLELERTTGGGELLRRNVCASREPLIHFVNDVVSVDAPVE